MWLFDLGEWQTVAVREGCNGQHLDHLGVADMVALAPIRGAVVDPGYEDPSRLVGGLGLDHGFGVFGDVAG